MSRGVNKAIIVGRSGSDPEVRYTTGGSAVANLRIATSEQWTDKASGEKKQQTEWHRVVAFGRLAEIIGEYVRKGSQIYIEGALRTRQYEKDGQTHYSTEIVAREMQLLDSRSGSENAGADRPAKGLEQPTNTPGGEDFSDDIPFAPYMRESH